MVLRTGFGNRSSYDGASIARRLFFVGGNLEGNVGDSGYLAHGSDGSMAAAADVPAPTFDDPYLRCWLRSLRLEDGEPVR